MRFFLFLSIFCLVFTSFAVFSPIKSHAQEFFGFGEKKHKYWWEEEGQGSGGGASASVPVTTAAPTHRNTGQVGHLQTWDASSDEKQWKQDVKRGWRKTKKFLFGVPKHDDAQPFLNPAKGPQNNQYDRDQWSPEIWAENRGSGQAVIDDFYAAGVITDQYDIDGVPYLEVGQPFLDLSFQDQRRVAMFVDHVYKMTDAGPNGMFRIVLDNWYRTKIGAYTKDGIYLQ